MLYTTVREATYPPQQLRDAEQRREQTIHTCLVHAHFLNSINPGSFGSELNKLYKANDHPSIIIIPGDPPSTTILNIMTKNTPVNTSICNTATPTQSSTNANNTPSQTSTNALDNIPLIKKHSNDNRQQLPT
ncbi:hypothetical protein E2C01_066581 [Portunus trituberculatus]|uniref:Uncharacterized protein n=1 Tax=Portunus trituberculatus TaxID=210409 RepID=A0A5B7HLX4_PORTR|nr:hypothetical protein [Portunus trituberculatus]